MASALSDIQTAPTQDRRMRGAERKYAYTFLTAVDNMAGVYSFLADEQKADTYEGIPSEFDTITVTVTEE